MKWSFKINTRKSINSNPLSEISVNTLHHKLSKGSNKKPLKRRLSISDAEDRDYDISSSSDAFFTKKCWLLQKFDEENNNGVAIHIEDLPWDLHMVILSYLPSNELIKTVQMLSKHWRNLLMDWWLWKIINENQPLNLWQRIRKVQLLAERRSKGKQFKAINRISGLELSVRKIYLDVTNAGKDDGLPTSVLRELSHLKSLNHPNVAK